MYVCERFTRAFLPPKWLNLRMRRAFSTFLSTLARIQQAVRAICAALKAVQAARSCAHWQMMYRSGPSRRRYPAVGFLLRPLGSFGHGILSTELRNGLLLLASKQRMTRAYLCVDAGTSGRPAWRRTSWRLRWRLGWRSNREVCKERVTRPKLTDAAKLSSKG